MLIGYEASALQGCKSGVGYYAENLLASMMEAAPQHDYLLFSNREINTSWAGLSERNIYKGRYFPVRLAWMQGVLPGTLRQVRPDIVHFPNYLAPVATSCPYVVTIHDMTLFITPQLHRWKKLLLDRTLIPLVARKAEAIVTVSRSARDDIVRLLKVPADKVHVVLNAVSPAFQRVEDAARIEEVRARHNLHVPYVLYVGNIEPRKNLVRLIDAFARIKKNGLPHKLVMVGQAGWHCEPIYAEVERQGLKSEVLFTGYVPFEDLPAIYSGAAALAFPSIYEGFGLPVLEAMACGTPVVTSRTSGLAEVADGAAVLVDPISVDEIASALTRVCTEPGLAGELSALGLARAREFTWQHAARSTIDVYEHVLSRRAVSPRRVTTRAVED